MSGHDEDHRAFLEATSPTASISTAPVTAGKGCVIATDRAMIDSSLRFARLCLWAGAALALAAGSARGESAAERFATEFADPIRQARLSPRRGDDLDLAERMLAAARPPDQDPALRALLCRAVFDLVGNRPDGAEAGVEAMELLRSAASADPADCDEKILGIRRRQYAAAAPDGRRAAAEAYVGALLRAADNCVADENYARAFNLADQAGRIAGVVRLPSVESVRARLRRLAGMELAGRQIRSLKKKLDADATDDSARDRLVELYLIEIDDPVKAAALLGEQSDEILRVYLPLATKGLDKIAPQVCLELGQWYQIALAPKATPAGKVAMLRRARSFYQAFLQAAGPAHPVRKQAAAALRKVEADLKGLAPPASAGQWIDVLREVDPAKYTYVGTWLRKGSRIGIASTAHSRIVIPVMAKGDYELSVRFVRTVGSNDVNVILPVAGRSVTLMLSNGNGASSGLSTIDGKMCDDNETRASGKLLNHKSYVLRAKVTAVGRDVRIAATVNGKRLLDWRGSPSALAPGLWTLPNPATLGLGVDSGSTVIFHYVKLRMLTGVAATAPAPITPLPTTQPTQPATQPATRPATQPASQPATPTTAPRVQQAAHSTITPRRKAPRRLV